MISTNIYLSNYPSTIFIFFYPAYASNNFCVCLGKIKLSSLAAIKNAGIYAFFTCLPNGSNAAISKLFCLYIKIYFLFYCAWNKW